MVATFKNANFCYSAQLLDWSNFLIFLLTSEGKVQHTKRSDIWIPYVDNIGKVIGFFGRCSKFFFPHSYIFDFGDVPIVMMVVLSSVQFWVQTPYLFMQPLCRVDAWFGVSLSSIIDLLINKGKLSKESHHNFIYTYLKIDFISG